MAPRIDSLSYDAPRVVVERGGRVGRGLSMALAAVIGCAGLVGCGTDEDPERTLTVTIEGPTDVELPAGSELHVDLVDISLADAPAAVIDEEDDDIASLPSVVELEYDADDIDDRHMYAVQARVEDNDGNLVLITDTAELVITNGAPTDSITVTLVGLT